MYPTNCNYSRNKKSKFTISDALIAETLRRVRLKQGGIFLQLRMSTFLNHNCGVGRSLSILKDQDPNLHSRYLLEKFRDSNSRTGKGSRTPEPKFTFKTPKFVKRLDLEKISDLNNSHPARIYLEKRGIKKLDYFYYCPKFKDWTNKQKKVFDTLRQDSPRIIIPFKDTDGTLFGYQGRSLAPKAKLRYISVMLDESKPKIFGLDTIDKTKDIYIVEGPFDSTFLENSVAMCVRR